MNAKQKANDLFQQMYNKIQTDELGLNYESAKRCAIIAVDEILWQADNWGVLQVIKYREYYKQVKTEIEKL